MAWKCLQIILKYLRLQPTTITFPHEHCHIIQSTHIVQSIQAEDFNFVYVVRVAVYSSLDLVAQAEEAFHSAARHAAEEGTMETELPLEAAAAAASGADGGGGGGGGGGGDDDVSDLGSAGAATVGRDMETGGENLSLKSGNDDDDDDDEDLSTKSEGGDGAAEGGDAHVPKLCECIEMVSLRADVSRDLDDLVK